MIEIIHKTFLLEEFGFLFYDWKNNFHRYNFHDSWNMQWKVAALKYDSYWTSLPFAQKNSMNDEDIDENNNKLFDDGANAHPLLQVIIRGKLTFKSQTMD